jgi:argininosuccinate lyase
VSTPPGYLGADARIRSGPAPELVEAGYQLEIDDAALLHDGLALADLAHLVSLVEADEVSTKEIKPLLDAVLDMAGKRPEDIDYDPLYGDAYNSRERVLQSQIGDNAGWLHLGRTRREAGRIAFRLALRDLLIDLYEEITNFGSALADKAEEHAQKLWADSTYLQPAQPSTFGHYLGAFAEEALRHLARVEAAYEWADQCPGGAGGAGGTRLRIDRTKLATLLGFSRPTNHCRDGMWATDGLIDAVTAATQAALTVDRLAEDLEIFASPAFGYVELDASLCRASVLMPQKRNPYALAVIRGGAGTLVGRLTGLLTTARTPSARTDNWLYAYGEVAGSLKLAIRLVKLGKAVVRGLQPNKEAMKKIAYEHFVGAADLAEDLALRDRVDYRTAYKIVGRAVADAYERGISQLDPPQDLMALVEARTGQGAASPDRVREHARGCRQTADWAQLRRTNNAEARDRLITRARNLSRQDEEEPGLRSSWGETRGVLGP